MDLFFLANWLEQGAESFDGAVLEGAHGNWRAAHHPGDLDTGQRREAKVDDLPLIGRQTVDRNEQRPPLVDGHDVVIQPNVGILEGVALDRCVIPDAGLVYHCVVSDGEQPGPENATGRIETVDRLERVQECDAGRILGRGLWQPLRAIAINRIDITVVEVYKSARIALERFQLVP